VLFVPNMNHQLGEELKNKKKGSTEREKENRKRTVNILNNFANIDDNRSPGHALEQEASAFLAGTRKVEAISQALITVPAL